MLRLQPAILTSHDRINNRRSFPLRSSSPTRGGLRQAISPGAAHGTNFGSDEACRAYLARLRWPDGFRCPRCGSSKSWPVRGWWDCAACGGQTSVTAGTIFQDTRSSLTVWFRTMWWVTTQKNGASALGLQGVLGLRSYETAWTWLHKLRRAMVRPGRDLLTGRVEVDGMRATWVDWKKAYVGD